MRRIVGVVALALAAAGLSEGPLAAADSKPAKEPFYRKYLVPGDPLDDKIVEQEHRVQASPDDPNLRNDFGNLLAERKFPAQAAEQYEIALKLDKKNFISAYNLGLLRETEGKVSAAIAAYKRSIKRKPGFPQSRFRLGRLYEMTNDPEAAVHEYAAALWIDPEMRDPRRNPLIIDCQLIYLASLANYHRDVAVAAMSDGKVYFDNDRFRKLPTTRSISSKEAEADEGEAAPAPRDVGGPGAAGAPGSVGPAEPVRRGPRATAPGSRVPPGTRRPAAPQKPQAGQAPPAGGPAAAPPSETAEPGPTPAGPETPPESAPEPAVTPPPEVEPS